MKIFIKKKGSSRACSQVEKSVDVVIVIFAVGCSFFVVRCFSWRPHKSFFVRHCPDCLLHISWRFVYSTHEVGVPAVSGAAAMSRREGRGQLALSIDDSSLTRLLCWQVRLAKQPPSAFRLPLTFAPLYENICLFLFGFIILFYYFFANMYSELPQPAVAAPKEAIRAKGRMWANV